MWLFSRKGPSGFSASSTAEEVTNGIDGSGLTAIVTGASSGIGAETARILAIRGVHVIMGVRNLAAGENIRDTIVKENSTAKVDVMELDLSSISSVRKFTLDFSSRKFPLNILISPSFSRRGAYTRVADAILLKRFPISMQYRGLLLDIMKKTASESGIEGRIVNVSSQGHRSSYREGIRFDKINNTSEYSSVYAYGQSKLANILHSNELSRRFKEEGVQITANSLHPGVIVTNLFRYHSIINGIVASIGKYIFKNVKQGAATTCYVALHPQVGSLSGKYFMDSNIAVPSSQAQDVELGKKLWDFSLGLTQ